MLDIRIAELQVVLELIDIHDGSDGHAVALENNVLLVAVHAADYLAELGTKLGEWKMADHLTPIL